MIKIRKLHYRFGNFRAKSTFVINFVHTKINRVIVSCRHFASSLRLYFGEILKLPTEINFHLTEITLINTIHYMLFVESEGSMFGTGELGTSCGETLETYRILSCSQYS